MGSDSLPQFSKPTSQLKVSPGPRCQREEDREGQPPGVELTAVATRTLATATAVEHRRATPTPMPTAPPTTTMEVDTVSTPRPLREPSLQAARPTPHTPTTTVGPPRPNISSQRRGRRQSTRTDQRQGCGSSKNGS